MRINKKIRMELLIMEFVYKVSNLLLVMQKINSNTYIKFSDKILHNINDKENIKNYITKELKLII